MENAKCFWKLVLFYFILFLPFYFPRKLILFYLKGKGGRIFCGLINLFVDSAYRRTRVTAKKSTTPSLFTYFWDPDLNHLGLFGMVCWERASPLLGVCSSGSPRRVLKGGPALALLAVQGSGLSGPRCHSPPRALVALSSRRRSGYFASRSWASLNCILLLGCRYKWWLVFCLA